MEEDILSTVIGSDEAITPNPVETHHTTSNHSNPQQIRTHCPDTLVRS